MSNYPRGISPAEAERAWGPVCDYCKGNQQMLRFNAPPDKKHGYFWYAEDEYEIKACPWCERPERPDIP